MQMQLFQTEPEVNRLHIELIKLQNATVAPNTVLGYGYDWQMFRTWCKGMGRRSLPATTETVALYLTYLLDQGKKVTTVRRRKAAIVYEHRRQAFPDPATPAVLRLLSGAQRLRKEKPRQMKPLSLCELRAIVGKLEQDRTAVAVRDQAVLMVGFASALRRSSLAALRIEDTEFAPKGLVLHVQGEKQDQNGKGRLIGVPRATQAAMCPVRALRAWLRIRGKRPGPLFCRLDYGHAGQALNGDSIIRIVKKCVARIGLDPTAYGAHSLRAGFVTEAGEAGVGELIIAAQTGHRSMDTLRRYFRRTNLWKANACTALGL